MDDYREIMKYGDTLVLLEVWESSKIPLGLVKWRIYKSDEGFMVGVGDTVVTTWDKALRDGRAMLRSTFEATTGLQT